MQAKYALAPLFWITRYMQRHNTENFHCVNVADQDAVKLNGLMFHCRSYNWLLAALDQSVG